MFFNYLLIAFRNLKRRKGYTLINLLGLSIGLCCVLLVSLFVKHEISYDSYHQNANRTFRIIGDYYYHQHATVSMHYLGLLEDALPEVDAMAQIRRTPLRFGEANDKRFPEPKTLITFTGNQTFDVFTFNFQEGSPNRAFSNPKTVLLTQSTAQRYFGETPALNQPFQWNGMELIVAGVVDDLPSNTHLQFDCLIHLEKHDMMGSWGAFTYLVLQSENQVQAVEEKLNQLADAREIYDQMDNFLLQPLKEIHMKSGISFDLDSNVDPQILWIFSGIALLILLLSAANYMNLAIAMHANRGKEISVRKTHGARRSQISFQFFVEALLLVILSLPLSLTLLQIVLPWFSNSMQVKLEMIDLFNSPLVILFIMGVVLVTGLLSGSYPALVLSRLQLLKLINDSTITSKKGVGIRRVMVGFQCVMIVFLLSLAFLFQNQMKFINNRSLGFDKDNVLKMRAFGIPDYQKYELLKERLLQHPDIKVVSNGIVPGDDDYASLSIKLKDKEGLIENVFSFGTDHDYFNVLNIQKESGPYFTEESHEKTSLLVNESFAKLIGEENLLDNTIILDPDKENRREYQVKGVYKDFHFFSLHEKPKPLFIFARNESEHPGQNVLVRFSTDDFEGLRAYIEESWYAIVPDAPLHWEFLSEDISEFYQYEQRILLFVEVLSMIALFIGLMGFGGLTAYLTYLRRKEIGIRRVFGAPIQSVLWLLNREFIQLSLWGSLIGSLFGYWVVSTWLERFAYQTTIGVFFFILITCLVLLSAILVVTIRALTTVRQNPSLLLKNE